MLQDRIVALEQRCAALERLTPVPPATKVAPLALPRYYKFMFDAHKHLFDPALDPFKHLPGTRMYLCASLLQDARKEGCVDLLESVLFDFEACSEPAEHYPIPDELDKVFPKPVVVVEGLLVTTDDQCSPAHSAALIEQAWGSSFTLVTYGDRESLDLSAMCMPGINGFNIKEYWEDSYERDTDALGNSPYVIELKDGRLWLGVLLASTLSCQTNLFRLDAAQEEVCLANLRQLHNRDLPIGFNPNLDRDLQVVNLFEHPILKTFMASKGIRFERRPFNEHFKEFW